MLRITKAVNQALDAAIGKQCKLSIFVVFPFLLLHTTPQFWRPNTGGESEHSSPITSSIHTGFTEHSSMKPCPWVETEAWD